MSKKKQNQVKVTFCGMNSENVTGSMILIESNNKKILLECGLFQSNNVKKDYENNMRKLDFKPKDIDYIFWGHSHIDHIGLTPRLYGEGCEAKIIAVKNTYDITRALLKDSAFIMSRDIQALGRRYKKSYAPIYDNDDVTKCLDSIVQYDYDEIHELDDEISFQFVSSGHIIQSAQIVLWIKQGNNTRKILYTSDLGNISVDKHYIRKFEAITNANLVIAESTYSRNDRSITQKDKLKDLEKIKTVVNQYCIERHGRVLIPIFSLDRTQNVLTLLYEIFGKDKNFQIPVILDSPLSCKMTEIYGRILEDEYEQQLFGRVMAWENLKLVKESDESKLIVEDKSPKIVLSASGMMTAGRSRHYTKSILPDLNSAILFVGFATEGSLAGKIKNSNKQKTICIDSKDYKNRCGIVDLKSFTSHMQYDDMLEYYSNINCEKIALVHGEFSDKCNFAKKLQEVISDKNKTSKVIAVNRSTTIIL